MRRNTNRNELTMDVKHCTAKMIALNNAEAKLTEQAEKLNRLHQLAAIAAESREKALRDGNEAALPSAIAAMILITDKFDRCMSEYNNKVIARVNEVTGLMEDSGLKRENIAIIKDTDLTHFKVSVRPSKDATVHWRYQLMVAAVVAHHIKNQDLILAQLTKLHPPLCISVKLPSLHENNAGYDVPGSGITADKLELMYNAELARQIPEKTPSLHLHVAGADMSPEERCAQRKAQQYLQQYSQPHGMWDSKVMENLESREKYLGTQCALCRGPGREPYTP